MMHYGCDAAGRALAEAGMAGKEALLARTGFYRDLLDIAIAHETADWEKVNVLLDRLGITKELVPVLYVSALNWASALHRGIHEYAAG